MSTPKPYSQSLKYKLWRRRLSVSASKISIRTHLPWPLRALMLALVLGLAGAVAMWAYDLGRSFTGFQPEARRAQVAALQAQIDKLRVERDEFATTVNASESRMTIERSVQAQLMNQIKGLEAQNIKLKEDLVFFESLLPADTGPQGITIRRLMADLVAPNQLRYRLLVMQGGKGDREFNGNLQLLVMVVQDGKSAMMNFPDGKSGLSEKFTLGFKHYQRVEGVLTLPQGVVIKQVQARILEKGQVRAQQSANL